jgi:hypothetical protein
LAGIRVLSVLSAKQSLLIICENGKDYILAKDGTKTAIFDRNEGDSEILNISKYRNEDDSEILYLSKNRLAAFHQDARARQMRTGLTPFGGSLPQDARAPVKGLTWFHRMAELDK